jgi:hypothetical protein
MTEVLKEGLDLTGKRSCRVLYICCVWSAMVRKFLWPLEN